MFFSLVFWAASIFFQFRSVTVSISIYGTQVYSFAAILAICRLCLYVFTHFSMVLSIENGIKPGKAQGSLSWIKVREWSLVIFQELCVLKFSLVSPSLSNGLSHTLNNNSHHRLKGDYLGALLFKIQEFDCIGALFFVWCVHPFLNDFEPKERDKTR